MAGHARRSAGGCGTHGDAIRTGGGMTRYDGLRAAVVGETAEIGLAIAKRLVEGGARVVLTAGTPARRADATAQLGPAGTVVAPGTLDGRALGGELDLVVADGVPAARPVLPHLADGGAVVLVDPVPAACVWTLADELAHRAIRVNAVASGCIEASAGGTAPLPPLGRLGSVEEVARAALFLATDATFTTGARLPVDGGVRRPPPPTPPGVPTTTTSRGTGAPQP